ncbi:hypothetical protein HUZ36_02430 [Pseudoalteromonas sp. McH1-7]|uniref:hypothetical protein n=1 Tax=Pseudoalteromonas sp. McH1-7 TaxID=2745574 RepID=UPI0015923E08|nr:hypothetical protein [Pseudoalteromonas sp. McH1-7]NUZ09630.1 hypothetical protein [Pseudoalteromonas sp. McH1-7]
MLRQEKLVGSQEKLVGSQEKLVGSQESFCYLVALNKKFLTLLASDLLLLIEQVLSQIGIILP